MSRFFAFFILVALVPGLLLAASFGSKSLLHVQTASVLSPHQFDVRTNLRFFTKVGDYLGSQKPANFRVVNYWLVQSNALLSYGVMDHFDVTFTTRVYQDTHKKNEYNSPDDLFLDFKVGSFELANNKMNLGGMLSLRIPTGEVHNYPFEEYTAGALEYGIMGLFSFYNDPYLPDRDISVHANLGWYNHNDAGKILYEVKNPQGEVIREYTAGSNAHELQYGLGFVYPTELFQLNLELWGNVFTSQPDTMAYSRENYLYITPSIRFRPRNWFNFDLGLDIRLSSDKNETSNRLPDLTKNLTLPNYPAWRMYLGLGFTLNQGAGRFEGRAGGTEVRKKVDFIESLLKEKEKTRTIEEELRRLKREREQAEKELEELRQLLEEQGGGK